jgi:hypothetical protein
VLLRALRALPSAVAAMPRRGDGRELKLGAGGEVEGEAGEAGAARLARARALAECVSTNWNTLFRVCLPGFVAVLFSEAMFFFFFKTSVVYPVVASGTRMPLRCVCMLGICCRILQ